MAVGTLVFDKSSYENVVCLGHILAEDGRKMSKHLGNILQPIPLMDQHGADAVRWFMAAGGSPWAARRVGPRHDPGGRPQDPPHVLEHGRLPGPVRPHVQLGARPRPTRPRPTARSWTAGCCRELQRAGATRSTQALEAYDTQRAGKLLSAFVDDLSNWYVRRSRRRFWQGDAAALRTLHEVVETVTRLMAPLTPFITERVWQDLVVPVTPDAPESVHLATWPEADLYADRPGAVQADGAGPPAGGAGPRHARGVRASRPASRCPARWSRRRASTTLAPELHAQITEELNVSSLASLSEVGGSLVDTTAKANFRALGKRFGKGVQAVAKAVAARRRGGAVPGPARGHGVGRGRRRDGHPRPGRGHHHRDPARGLVGGVRLGRDGRPGPGDHPGAAARGPGP